MSKYRRVYIPEGMYFFTLVTYQRKNILRSENAIKRLRLAFRYALQKSNAKIAALVILPDHLHCILDFEDHSSDYSLFWSLFKRYFSSGFLSEGNHRREKNIWQRRFWEHTIRDDKDFQRHLDYIYYNPVKHCYVKRPYDWPYSTFRRDVKSGLYDANWGNMGEPLRIIGLNFE